MTSRKARCMVCGAPGRRYCPTPCKPLVVAYRERLRHTAHWLIAYTQGDVGDVLSNGQESVCLWDLLTLAQATERLAPSQRDSVRAFLLADLSEADAARAMGVDPRARVGTIATDGVARLLGMAYRGEIACRLDDGPRLSLSQPTSTPPQQGSASGRSEMFEVAPTHKEMA